jgi:hypothetical protein
MVYQGADSSDIMQEEWHMAIVCPIHKKGDECRMKKYHYHMSAIKY